MQAAEQSDDYLGMLNPAQRQAALDRLLPLQRADLTDAGEVAADIGPGLAMSALGAVVDGEVVDLCTPIESVAGLALITPVDRSTGEVHYGRVPAYSVVVPGALPGVGPDGNPGPSLYCAVIVKRVEAGTRAKTSINDLLRD